MRQASSRIFMIAGEASGDLAGGLASGRPTSYWDCYLLRQEQRPR